MKPDSDLLTIIREQESKLVFAEFDSSTAWALGSAVRDAFLASPAYIEQARSIVIAVELFSGLTLFRAAVGDGVSADNWCAAAAVPSPRTLGALIACMLGSGLRGRRTLCAASASPHSRSAVSWRPRRRRSPRSMRCRRRSTLHTAARSLCV